jgi:uncharacterized protein (UPF0303 family)
MNDDQQALISSLDAHEALGVEPRLFAAHGGAFPIRIRDVGVASTGAWLSVGARAGGQ